MDRFINNYIKQSQSLLKGLPVKEIAKALNILQATYERDGRIYVFGNGGSLSMATHWVADFNKTVFSGHLEKNLRRFQAIRIPTTESEITAWANDVGFEMIFAGPLKNYIKEGDTVIAISSSGNSPNVIKAVELAKEYKASVIGVTGFDGGQLNKMADAKILVKSEKGAYELVEGIHSVILHMMTLYFKNAFNYQVESEKNIRRVLVTGNQGYIGTVLSQVLSDKGYEIVGLDTNYFDGIIKPQKPKNFIKQINKDIRDISLEDFQGIDAVIHLAALSNDPLGELAPSLTEEINYKATIKTSRLAKKAGIKRFIYSSSQSMYGISETDEELDEDNSAKNAITAYAKTKWQAEQELKELGSDKFIVVCFRPSTVFGASPKLRSDIVFNNLVACAYTSGKIEIKSDGTPWRPVVHVRDVCNSYIAGLEAPEKLVANESFNVGIPDGNFTVRDLAEAAQRAVPGSSLVFTGEHGKDARTYKVSFKKILTVLKDYFKPEWDLDRGGKELVEFFKKINFSEKDFRGRKTNRLAQLKYLIEKDKIDKKLFWQKKV